MAEEKRTETETGGETGQHALLARGMQEGVNEERSPPGHLRVLNACDHPGGEGGGGTHLEACAYGAHTGGI